MQSLEDDDPRRVGEYRLLRRLGAGGMGRVYLGRSARGRTVAVKVVRPELAGDQEFRARFRREVDAARRVGGEWTAPVLDADTEGERPWVATGYVAGPSLSSAVREFGPLPGASVRALGVRLAEALAHVHALGLVHRDVKPSNVLLAPDGPRLIDFGITRALDANTSLTRPGYMVGSPGFMSPEQTRGSNVGPASDVFSLGAVLAYAATGVLPYGEGVAPAVLFRAVYEQPDLLLVDETLRRNLLGCLAKDPAARPSPQLLRAWLDDDREATRDLARGSWLPLPVAAAIGRAAAELLDLETDRTGTTHAVPPRPASTPPRPEPTPRPTPGPTPTPRRPTVPPPGPAPTVPHHRPTDPTRPATPTRQWQPLPPEPIPVYGPPRYQPPRRRRGRLVLVLVVLVVLLIAAAGYALTHQEAQSSTTDSAPAAAGTAPGVPVGGAARNVVPAAYLGTWSGQAVHSDSTPAGVVTLTVGPGGIGDQSTDSRLDNGATRCEAVWTLVEVSALSLTYTSRLVRGTPGGGCTGGDANDRRTLLIERDGTIHYGVSRAGVVSQVAVLRKTG
ncbi:serine/threonine-protein kinase [Streptomyces sp. SP17BM10]|uniref:serine/threonine-protein kinase n=1 Tax=Streptomyces sp. SP17BM10 TaxID=3002530 RepID=UPI002E796905|nr:serine/threonine-protein kinase [Streptomyces sp. SP17BM10]MEE1783700.1 serine/threonine-protein kinase [Streptomyces sp. SP17BM10]